MSPTEVNFSISEEELELRKQISRRVGWILIASSIVFDIVLYIFMMPNSAEMRISYTFSVGQMMGYSLGFFIAVGSYFTFNISPGQKEIPVREDSRHNDVRCRAL